MSDRKARQKKKLVDLRDKVSVEKNEVRHTHELSHPDAMKALGIDLEFKLESFFRNLRIDVKQLDETKRFMEFDLIGVDTSIANALRRILLSEIPTMAVDEVTFVSNSSVLHDEVLAHRLGLVPFEIDARQWPFVGESESGEYDDGNTLVFKLHKGNCDKHRLTVTSGDLEWVPQTGQLEWLTAKGLAEPRVVHRDIVVAKLAKGQEIECWMKVCKGIGRKHAKWSPVGTAFYRLLPEITVDDTVHATMDSAAKKQLKELCPMNVFDIEEIVAEPSADSDDEDVVVVSGSGEDLSERVVAKRPRVCTMCRTCLEKGVKIQRIRNHFIFQIESVGQYPVKDLFDEAIKVLSAKCLALLEHVKQLQQREEDGGDEDAQWYGDENMEFVE